MIYNKPKGGSPRRPNSRMTRALVSLKESDTWEPDDFLRAIATACDTPEQMRQLSNQMQKDGIYRRMVVLTDKGKAAIEAAKRVREQG